MCLVQLSIIKNDLMHGAARNEDEPLDTGLFGHFHQTQAADDVGLGKVHNVSTAEGAAPGHSAVHDSLGTLDQLRRGFRIIQLAGDPLDLGFVDKTRAIAR